ncbi:unnamed protein product [Pedinophyceae sp. YPF-701]|nr:unnamed protein product [Pedinophyceae sp. YPF-701]
MEVDGGPSAPSEGPRHRMIIREMHLENFKSYAGLQKIGPFHKSFSAVVGPNGSGKSNVIDSLLFVFGWRAHKLRLRKVSELIHNSSSHPDLDYARVSVYFQDIVDTGEDTYDLVEGTELCIARQANRDNTSSYYINGKRADLKEVQARLKAKGVDLANNRFLILQGEVEQISLMKPKGKDENDTGLLEYLEEIIGTSELVAPIADKARELEESSERRAGVLKRVRHAEGELGALEGAKDEAEAYLAKDGELKRWQATHCQLVLRQVRAGLAQVAESRAAATERLAHEKEKARAFEDALKEAEGRFAAMEGEYKVLCQEVDAVVGEFREYEKQDVKYREDMRHLKSRKKAAGQKLEKAQQKAESLRRETARCREEAPRLEERAGELEAQLERDQKKLDILMDECRAEIQAIKAELVAARERLAPYEAQRAELESDLGVDGRAAADALAAELAGAEGELARARKAGERAGAEERRLQGAVNEARGRLEERRATAREAQGRSRVAAAVEMLRRSGQVRGIYGRLGDLGSIDAKYDVAVSTACGGLDWVVVDTAETAQRCVEYLRKHNIGVATFLILEKQRHLTKAAGERVETPEGVPRLYDLVHVSAPELRPAFYYALRDTIVTETLDQAARIAYAPGNKRFRRAVTLGGELIADSGAMTGGGAKPRGGRMALGDRPPAAPDAASDAAAEREARKLEGALAEATEALRAAREEIDAAAAAARQAEDAAAAALAEAEAGVRERAGDAKRAAVLEKECARLEAALAKLARDNAGLTAEAERLQKALDDVAGGSVRRQRDRVENLARDIDEARAAAIKAKAQAATQEKQLGRAAAEAEKLAAEVARCEEELRERKAAQEELERAATEVMQRMNEAKALKERRFEELEELRGEFGSKEREARTVRKVAAELKSKLEELADREKEEQRKERHWAKELRSVQAARTAAVAGGGTGEDEGVEPPLLSDDELDGLKVDEVQYRVVVLEGELADMQPDMGAIAAYRAREADYRGRIAELEAATRERDAARGAHDALRKRRLDEFMAGFNVITLKLKEMYQMITLGGDAELELVDSCDPFSEGIVFSVRPPKKSWKNIANLSGGEKTLSSLALVFALHHYRPTPLYVMDEIDAALDFKNVSIVGHYIKERTKDAQFVIISLRNNMFELADRLVGIYKTDDATKSVTIDPRAFAVGAPAPERDVAAAGEEAVAPRPEGLAA